MIKVRLNPQSGFHTVNNLFFIREMVLVVFLFLQTTCRLTFSFPRIQCLILSILLVLAVYIFSVLFLNRFFLGVLRFN